MTTENKHLIAAVQKLVRSIRRGVRPGLRGFVDTVARDSVTLTPDEVEALLEGLNEASRRIEAANDFLRGLQKASVSVGKKFVRTIKAATWMFR